MTGRSPSKHSSRPVLLDLFCGAGGAAKGYYGAGFKVVGVDIAPQPRYPFGFIQGDALDVLRRLLAGRNVASTKGWHLLGGFVAIHASPPCQRHSAMSNCRPGLADDYPDLIGPTRELLDATGLPYIIENVPGAPMRADVTLCGQMFGLPLYRHRLFESNVPLVQPAHPPHTIPASRAGHWTPGTIMSVSGHAAPVALAREAMGIDWTNREELAEAIPPAFTEWVGAQLLAHIQQEAVAA